MRTVQVELYEYTAVLLPLRFYKMSHNTYYILFLHINLARAKREISANLGTEKRIIFCDCVIVIATNRFDRFKRCYTQVIRHRILVEFFSVKLRSNRFEIATFKNI